MKTNSFNYIGLHMLVISLLISCGGENSLDLMEPQAGKAEVDHVGLSSEFPEFSTAVIRYRQAELELARVDVPYVEDGEELPEELAPTEEGPSYEGDAADENLVYAAAWIGITREWLELARGYDHGLGEGLPQIPEELDDSAENELLLNEAYNIFLLMTESPDFHKLVLPDCELGAKDALSSYMDCEHYRGALLLEESSSYHEIAREIFRKRPGALWQGLLGGLLPVAPALMASVGVMTWTLAVNMATGLGISFAGSATYASIVTMVGQMINRFGPDKLIAALTRSRDAMIWSAVTVRGLKSNLPQQLAQSLKLFPVSQDKMAFAIQVTRYQQPFTLTFLQQGKDVRVSLSTRYVKYVEDMFDHWVNVCDKLGLATLYTGAKGNDYVAHATMRFTSASKLDPNVVKVVKALADDV